MMFDEQDLKEAHAKGRKEVVKEVLDILNVLSVRHKLRLEREASMALVMAADAIRAVVVTNIDPPPRKPPMMVKAK